MYTVKIFCILMMHWIKWSPRSDLNRWPFPYRGNALPAELHGPGVDMVEERGFEPLKAEPADLQSAPFDHSGTPPQWSRRSDLNGRPADYKSAALPTELHRHKNLPYHYQHQKVDCQETNTKYLSWLRKKQY